jgi:hypothetical protein
MCGGGRIVSPGGEITRDTIFVSPGFFLNYFNQSSEWYFDFHYHLMFHSISKCLLCLTVPNHRKCCGGGRAFHKMPSTGPKNENLLGSYSIFNSFSCSIFFAFSFIFSHVKRSLTRPTFLFFFPSYIYTHTHTHVCVCIGRKWTLIHFGTPFVFFGFFFVFVFDKNFG